jgi:glycosyltransferase involved in cell wall biosynthesis
MNIYINACNLHTSGGKVILNDLISATKYFKDINFTFYIDPRFKFHVSERNNVYFKIIKKYQRALVWHLIERNIKNDDIIIYLTNIPPIIKHKCMTILVQSNRFVIDKYTLKGFSLKTKIRINIERLLFYIGKKNVDYIIVQSSTMQSILGDLGINEEKIKIIAYKDKEKLNNEKNDKTQRAPNEFLYVSSDDPHKNHIKLIESWCFLSEEGLYPKLILTINVNTKLFRWIASKIDTCNLNVEVKPNLHRNEVLNLYKSSAALIYPSLFESYGLPLVEAVRYNLPVIASELDYVRDILEPAETFDPNSAKSIYRSVKRFLKIEVKKTEIVSPVEFINKVMKL